MDITTERFISLLALVIAASWGSYSLEALPVHPVVRRGLQTAIMLGTAVWTLRLLRAL